MRGVANQTTHVRELAIARFPYQRSQSGGEDYACTRTGSAPRGKEERPDHVYKEEIQRSGGKVLVTGGGDELQRIQVVVFRFIRE